MKRILTFLSLLFVLFCWPIQSVFGYDHSATHPLLTQETVEFFRQRVGGKIDENDLWHLMRGSSLEDEPASRTINHFFDPIKNSGLHGQAVDILSPALNVLSSLIVSSKEWANDSSAQANFLGQFYENAALNPYARLAKNPIELEAVKTWDKAIYLYLSDQREESMEVLGHTLHLLQDLAVPAHTRNDPHAFGDPYEKWASQFGPGDQNISSQLGDLPFKVFFRLDDYFDSLANYTNSHFFSKDSISWKNIYSQPLIEYLDSTKDGDIFYFYGKDDFGKFKLAMTADKGGFFVNFNGLSAQDEKIYQDYWSHLSRQAVLYGAGLLDFFFKEAERLKNNNDFLLKNQDTVLKKWQAKIAGLFGSLAGEGDDSLNPDPIEEGDQNAVATEENGAPDNPSNNSLPTSDDQSETGGADFQEERNEIDLTPADKPELFIPSTTYPAASTSPKPKISPSASPSSSPVPSVSPSASPKPTSSPKNSPSTSPFPSPTQTTQPYISGGTQISINWCNQNNPVALTGEKSVVINEVAWAGGIDSSSDEWIELKNISGQAININNWQLIDKAAQIKISFGRQGENTVISPGDFFLLERTDDQSVSGITADLIYSGGLNNSDEFLRLLSSNCVLQDEVWADPDWPGGDNAEKRSLERGLNLNVWQTYGDSGQSGVMGTPRANNSDGLPVDSGDDEEDGDSEEVLPSPSPGNNPEEPPLGGAQAAGGSPAAHPVVAEFLFDAEGEDIGWEFVEIYNPTENEIDLSGWKLRVGPPAGEADSLAVFGSKNEDKTIIPSKGYLLIGLGDYDFLNYAGVLADIGRAAGLPQTDEAGYFLELLDGEKNIIDSVFYKSGNAEPGQSLERKANPGSIIETMIAEGEDALAGNGYDSNDQSDFIVRSAAQPQNSSSPPEPREAPPALENISGYLRETDGMPMIVFDLNKATTTETGFVFKYSTSTENFSWDEGIDLEIKNFSQNNNGRWEIEIPDMNPGGYWFAGRSKDKWNAYSAISEKYNFILPECWPQKVDVGHPFVKDISFYSCLGKYWLDFSLIDYPNPMPSDWLGLGVYFFLNKPEKEICLGSVTDCFTSFESVQSGALAAVGWGGSFLSSPSTAPSAVFYGSKSVSSESDFNLVSGQHFHFEVAGFYDESDQLIPSNFSMNDYIVPIVLGWNGNNPWWRYPQDYGRSQDGVFFENRPLSDPVMAADDFSGELDEAAGKIVFNFASNGAADKYEIRYLADAQLTGYNWEGGEVVAAGNFSGQGEKRISSQDFPIEKNSFFGLRLAKEEKWSPVSRTNVYIPYPLLNCAYYSEFNLLCDNFNSYNPGENINGKNGWSANQPAFVIAENNGKRDSNSLKADFDRSSGGLISGDFNAPSEKGGLSFWVMRGTDKALATVKIGQGINLRFWQEPSDAAIYLAEGAAKAAYQYGYFGNIGEWQKWSVKWDAGEGKYWFRINEKPWQEMNWIDAGPSSADKITITVNAGKMFFEDIKPIEY